MPPPLPAPGLFSHLIPSRPTYLNRTFTHALTSAHKLRSSDLRISEVDLDPVSARKEADEPALRPRSERDLHLRRLYDLLFVSLDRKDVQRCRRIYDILLRSHEWHPAELWRVGLEIAGMPTDDETQGVVDDHRREQAERARRERKIRFVRRLMQRRPGLRVALVSELIPLLIAQERYSEASEELELVLTTWPYRQEPLLHLYSGMLILHSASQSAASLSTILIDPASSQGQASLPRRKRVPANLEAARHDHDLRQAQSAFESALSAGANKYEAMRRREMRTMSLLKRREEKRERRSQSRSRSRSRGRSRPWENDDEDEGGFRSEESALEDTQQEGKKSDDEGRKMRVEDEGDEGEEETYGSSLDDGLAQWAVAEAEAYLEEIVALRQTVNPRASQQGKMLEGVSRASSRERSASRGRSQSRGREGKDKGQKEEGKGRDKGGKKRERSASEAEERSGRKRRDKDKDKRSEDRTRIRPADSPEVVG